MVSTSSLFRTRIIFSFLTDFSMGTPSEPKFTPSAQGSLSIMVTHVFETCDKLTVCASFHKTGCRLCYPEQSSPADAQARGHAVDRQMNPRQLPLDARPGAASKHAVHRVPARKRLAVEQRVAGMRRPVRLHHPSVGWRPRDVAARSPPRKSPEPPALHRRRRRQFAV